MKAGLNNFSDQQEEGFDAASDITATMEWDNLALERSSPQYRQQLYAEEMFGSAALVVVGEPTSEQHKDAILQRVTHGK